MNNRNCVTHKAYMPTENWGLISFAGNMLMFSRNISIS